MYPVLFNFGPITIYTYGFLVFLGVLFGYLVSLRAATKEGIKSGVFSDIVFWMLVISFLGARVFYILVDFRSFLANPLEVLLSRSGFVFYGGVISGIISVYFLANRKKINFLKICDLIALGLPLAHAFGRLGCFSYGCCYGRPTNSFIGILFPANSPAGELGTKVIPTQLIEALFLLILFFLLQIIRKYKKFDGQIIASYIVLYGIFRFFIEFFRADPRGNILFLSVSQFISIILVGFGAFVWVKHVRSGK